MSRGFMVSHEQSRTCHEYISYKELAMREDLRVDLRDGTHIRSQTQKRGASKKIKHMIMNKNI